ncbi:MAG: AI-2E family transporter [Gemmatimonadaceae bacterium]
MATQTGRTATRLLGIVCAILVVAALKEAKSVLAPLALATFVIIAAWPIQDWLERRVPRWLAAVCTITVVLIVTSLIIGAVFWSVEQVAVRAPRIAQRLGDLSGEFGAWGRRLGMPVTNESANEQLVSQLSSFGRTLAPALYSSVVMLALGVAFLILGLLEVRDFEAKVTTRLRRHVGDTVLEAGRTIAHQTRRHLVALTLSSAVSGVLTTGFAIAMGLELALTWGIIAFLLNYIATVGPALAVIPPTLFALVQFTGPGRPLAVFLGIGAIQFLMGNFVDPKIEGRVLSLSPIVVLFAIVFWGWVWGWLGAILAVPLMAAVIIACAQFEGTRWVAALLSDIGDDEKRSA